MEEEQEIKKTYFRFSNEDVWRKALRSAPKSEWVLSRKIGGNKKSSYVPLFVQQALVDIFFREFDVIDEKYILVSNEILCTVKIQFLPDFPDSEHRFMTGVAAKPIQQDSGISASSFPTGKKANALEYNAPASRSAAVSNALNNFANIFGRNLNRDVRNDYSMDKKEETKTE